MRKYFKKIIASLAILALISSIGFNNTAQASTFSLAQAAITNSETTGTGTYSVGTFGSSITVGNVILCSATSDDNNAGEITSITDSKGNVFVKDFEQNSTAQQVSLWRAPVTVGGTSDTVTVNYRAADSNNSGAACQEWAFGGTGTLTVDKTKGATGTSASLSTGASTATTQNVELVFVGSVDALTNTTCTAGTGYSNVAFKTVSAANVCIDSLETAATGAQTGLQTWTTSRNYGIGLVTYFVAGAVVVTGGGGTKYAVVGGSLKISGGSLKIQ